MLSQLSSLPLSSEAAPAYNDGGGFAGEVFLIHWLPAYAQERFLLTIKLVLVMVFWLLVVPYISAQQGSKKKKKKVSQGNHNNNGATVESNELTQKKNIRLSRKSTSHAKKKQPSQSENATATKQDGAAVPSEEAGVSVVMVSLAVIMCIFSVGWVVLGSSNNSFTARGVFEAPLLTSNECRIVLDMAQQAAQRNYNDALAKQVGNTNNNNNTVQALLLQDPHGWQKSRHSSYPTIDLNIVTDPFTKLDREYIQNKLDARLAPLLQRIYGVVPSAIRAQDMFVVRYDAETRPFLEKHTDDMDLSFNVLLNDEFEGGGTRFWDRKEGRPFATIQPTQVGQVLINSALILHEGLAITKGTRYIFVGFLAVDRTDPFTGKPTGLGMYDSWLSLPWMVRRLKNGYNAAYSRLRDRRQSRRSKTEERKWTDNRYARSLFRDAFEYFQEIGDVLAPHFHANLVREEDSERYLSSMDDACAAASNEDKAQQRASWYSGQQIDVDIDGKISRIWTTRDGSESKFTDL